MLDLNSELVKLNNLQLAAKVVSDKMNIGVHRSKRIGFGVEFEQYRHYFPGDDLSKVDWKLYARTEKIMVKESSIEGSLEIKLILDLTGSMNYKEKGISRLDYGKILLASLAYLAFKQGDDISLFVLKNGGLETLVKPARNAFYNLLYELENAKAEGEWIPGQASFPQFQRKNRELVILVTDLLQNGNEWVEIIENIAGPNRQIMVFQVLGKEETDFDLKGFYRFKDLESGKEYELDAQSIKDDFRNKAGKYLKHIDRKLRIDNVNLVRARLDENIPSVLTGAIRNSGMI